MRHSIVAGLIVITCLLSSIPASSYGYPGGWNGTWSLWHAETPMVGQTVWKHFGDIEINEYLIDWSNYGIVWNIQGNNIRWSVDGFPSYENNGGILAIPETIQSGNMAGTNAKFSATWQDEVPGGSYWDSFKPTNIQCIEDNKGIIEIKKEVPNYADLMNEMLKIRAKDPESGAIRPYGPEDFFSARIRMCQDQYYEDIWGFRIDRKVIGGERNPEEETDSSGSLLLSTNQGETEVKAGDTIKLSPEEKIKLTAKCDRLIELVAANIGEDRNIDTSLFTIAEYFWIGKNITSGHLPSVQAGSFLNVKKAFYSCIKLLYGKNSQSLSKQFISEDPSELPAQIELNLEKGPFVAEVVNDQVLLGIDTATMTATSIGKNTFGVVYDPTSGIGFVIAYDNPVNIKPKNSNLAPFTLGAGQMVGISMDKVSPIIPISPTQGGSEIGGQQGSTYVSPDGKDIYGPTGGAIQPAASGAAQGGYPDITGIWYLGGPYDEGRPCQILHNGNALIFINDNGGQSGGGFVDSGTVVASDWQGLQGKISDGGKRIDWSNGSWWVRNSQQGNSQIPSSGGCYQDPFTGEITCVDTSGNPISSASSQGNPQGPSSGGCYQDPFTGEITCVDTSGNPGSFVSGQGNSQGISSGGCYEDPVTGEITCVDSTGTPEDLSAP